MLLIHKG
ncbi:hypothetical protein ZEAMMB73_Zm00001d052620 [Zea mays]|nr:hypothetical protein ZEAMMB73_Zm00001d052620 [Zea mays]AQK57514.1 hypothetical protein ZEAMMB73_Zm00001d052620 [Zea mays]AQK57516.1 hypothetical protein ZEAMMB73_Zm00001d052620 [Zea mays]